MMIQKGTVIGAKQFKGNIEGRDYDSCKLRVMMAVPEGSENQPPSGGCELKREM